MALVVVCCEFLSLFHSFFFLFIFLPYALVVFSCEACLAYMTSCYRHTSPSSCLRRPPAGVQLPPRLLPPRCRNTRFYDTHRNKQKKISCGCEGYSHPGCRQRLRPVCGVRLGKRTRRGFTGTPRILQETRSHSGHHIRVALY